MDKDDSNITGGSDSSTYYNAPHTSYGYSVNNTLNNILLNGQSNITVRSNGNWYWESGVGLRPSTNSSGTIWGRVWGGKLYVQLPTINPNYPNQTYRYRITARWNQMS